MTAGRKRIWKKRGSRYNFDWHQEDEKNPNIDSDWTPPAEYKHFCGEGVLKEAYDECYKYDSALCLVSLFVTGARCSEFIQFKVSMFKKDEQTNTIYGYGLPVLKREKGATRNINILWEDPLVPEFWAEVENIRKHYGEDEYLTASIRESRDEWLQKYDSEIEYLKKQVSEIKKQKGVTIAAYQEAEDIKAKQKELEKAQQNRLKNIKYRLYQDVYDNVTSIMKPPHSEIKRLREEEEKNGEYKVKTGPWFPHRLRMERASHLASERGYDTPLLMTFFGWLRSDTPTNYVKQSAQELLARNLDSRFDKARRLEARSNAAESMTLRNTTPAPSNEVPKYLT